MTPTSDRHWLGRAAHAAALGHGYVAPNPPVGCAIVSPDGTLLALAHHRRCGEAHAEINALAMAGNAAAGATVFVTLEPCTHQGRTGPCTQALLDASVARVVIGCADGNPVAAGGINALREGGIQVDLVHHQPSHDLAAPHRRRCIDGRPWVRCKWAQTLDGYVATRTGHSQWISNATSRRQVHRERGRVDAILTGIGTVLADDCRLTVRNVIARRTPARVVIDRDLRTPPACKLLQTIDKAPLHLIARQSADATRKQVLLDAGVVIHDFPCHTDGRFDLDAVMRHLWSHCGFAEVLVEAGPKLIGALLADSLIDELAIYLAPKLLGDGAAMPPLTGLSSDKLKQSPGFRLLGTHRRAGDALLRYIAQ